MGKHSGIFSLDRYRLRALNHAKRSSSNSKHYPGTGKVPILPLHQSGTQTGTADAVPGLNNQSDGSKRYAASEHIAPDFTVWSSHEHTQSASPPPAPFKSEASGTPITSLTLSEKSEVIPPLKTRMYAACERFVIHSKNALFHSWMNVLLVFVPVGIVVKALNLNASVVFALNAIAIVPLAGLLTYATESVARRLGDTLGALLNVSFGNAVELIIFIIALAKNEIRIVQASLLGSILSNLLLILGMAFLLGGLRYREQIYNSTVTQMSACLLSLSVMSLLLPTAFHASFNEQSAAAADLAVLRISRGTSVILLLVYILYLLFQLKSHAYLYESTPQAIIDEESHPGVLADVLGSSSSSDDSSTSGDSDSDTSGSMVTTRKKLRRKMFRRRRRKSSASASSTTRSSVMMSALSSPSTTERQESYWESHTLPATGLSSRLGAIASGDEADIQGDDMAPRVRDFVLPRSTLVTSNEKNLKHKQTRLSQSKRTVNKSDKQVVNGALALNHEMDGHDTQHATIRETNLGLVRTTSPSDQTVDVNVDKQATSSGRLAFTMRQISTRAAFRPSFPKVLSNNVFVQTDPLAAATRPGLPNSNSLPVRNTLRRTSSLPDRLNFARQQDTNEVHLIRSGNPLPPYQHTRPLVERNPELTTGDDNGAHADQGPLELSRTAAMILLLLSTGLVAACAEFMVDAIPEMLKNNSGVSQAFVGLIILPIVSNAAEHVTAVTVAAKNKMDLAIGVAVGSSIQIALFVTPIVVLLGWILKTDMSLYFNLFETISLFVTAFVVNFLVLDGRSNYLEGSLLIAAYVIIAVGAFYYPSDQNLSSLGGGAN